MEEQVALIRRAEEKFGLDRTAISLRLGLARGTVDHAACGHQPLGAASLGRLRRLVEEQEAAGLGEEGGSYQIAPTPDIVGDVLALAASEDMRELAKQVSETLGISEDEALKMLIEKKLRSASK